MEDVGVARYWGLAKIAVEGRVNTGPIDLRGVGTAVVVSEGGAVVPLRDAAEGGGRKD